MVVELQWLITFVFGISGCIGVWYGVSRNRRSDLKQDAGIAFELKALQASLTEFKTEIKIAVDNTGRMDAAFAQIDELKGGARQ